MSSPCFVKRNSITANPRDSKKLSVTEEIHLISKCLHARHKEFFRATMEPFLTEEEKELIQAAESLKINQQACFVFDQVVYRLTRRYAELIDWPDHAIAKVVETAIQLKSDLRCLVLDMSPSRGLQGKVAFKISDPQVIPARFPAPVLLTLKNTLPHWSQVAYLEPIYHENHVLQSISAVKRYQCRPQDPIIAGFLGTGPTNYGYPLGTTWQPVTRQRKEHPLLVFIIAHWD
jgi:hypothetical protein